jgi:hypothetical protein
LSKSERSAIAHNTLDIVQAGWYDLKGTRKNIGSFVSQSLKDTRIYVDDVPKNVNSNKFKSPVSIEVKCCTTLQAASILATELKNLNSESAKPSKEEGSNVNNNNNNNANPANSTLGILNFASAKNPGGGSCFLFLFFKFLFFFV